MASGLAADLAAHVREGARHPIRWGENDCAIWACDWVRRITGRDPAMDLRGRYSSPMGYMRRAVEYGGFDTMIAACAASASLREIAPRDARLGDVGMIEMPGVEGSRAIALKGRTAWLAKTETGIGRADVVALQAWRVG